jgi:gliding motility-associated-like protein
MYGVTVSGQFCCYRLTKMKRTSQPEQDKSILKQLRTKSCRIIRVMMLFFITGMTSLAQQTGDEAVSPGSLCNLEQETYFDDFPIVPDKAVVVILNTSTTLAETAAPRGDKIYRADTVTANVLSCELVIPNGFSPNNDGIQDTWRIKCIENYPNARVEVFNRWGNLVFNKENYGNIDLHGPEDAWWDGRSTHKWTLGKDILPAGTYFYILDLKDGSKPRNGFLYLNR